MKKLTSQILWLIIAIYAFAVLLSPPISRLGCLAASSGWTARESYRKLRLEPLCFPHRLSRGTVPHEREHPRRKDRS
jgi:hypothetical protein